MQRSVDIAAFLSTYSQVLIQSPEPFPVEALEKYRAAARQRLAHWFKIFEIEKARLTTPPSPVPSERWTRVLSVTEEILVTELLTRVWGGILAAKDRFHNRVDTEPLARHLLLGHLDAHRRAFALMLHGPGPRLEELGKIDRIRRRVERWTDVLLGKIVCEHGVAEFACDAERAEEFGKARITEGTTAGGHQPWKVMLMSLRVAFADVPNSVDDPWQDILHQAILGCLPQESFGPEGIPLSDWERRLSQVYDRMQPASRIGNPAESADGTTKETAAQDEKHRPRKHSMIPLPSRTFRRRRE